MATIKINKFVSLNVYPEFEDIETIKIDEKPFAEGGFGKIYYCKKINGKKPPLEQVIKIFKDNGSGSAAHSLRTTKGIIQKLLHTKNEMKAFQLDFFHEYPALIGMPQFVFEGELNDEYIAGFSSNNLVKLGFVPFSNVLNTDLINKYFGIKFELLYAKAYHLSRAFQLLNSYHFIHADLKTDNMFVHLTSGQIALIDFDSGAIIEKPDDDTYTWGTPQDMLAPEIFSQIKINNDIISVNLNTDKWSVAVAIHYLIMAYHPLFYLKDLGENTIKQYFSENKWPEIDKTKPYFLSDNSEAYDQYFEWIKNLPKEIYESLYYTINSGYNSPNNRSTYDQWIFSFINYIPEEEKRKSFSKIKIKASQSKYVSKEKKEEQERKQKEQQEREKHEQAKNKFVKYINNLFKKILNEEIFVYEYKEEISKMAEQVGQPNYYNKFDKLLVAYYEAIADNIITQTERSKLKFLSKTALIDYKIIENKFKQYKQV